MKNKRLYAFSIIIAAFCALLASPVPAQEINQALLSTLLGDKSQIKQLLDAGGQPGSGADQKSNFDLQPDAPIYPTMPSKIELEYRERLKNQNRGILPESQLEADQPLKKPATSAESPNAAPQQNNMPPQNQPGTAGEITLMQPSQTMQAQMMGNLTAEQRKAFLSQQQADQAANIYPNGQEQGQTNTSQYSLSELQLLKLKLKRQLDELELISQKDPKDAAALKNQSNIDEMKAGIQRQLMRLSMLEAQRSELEVNQMTQMEGKKIRKDEMSPSVLKNAVKASKLFDISSEIDQFGYRFFYQSGLPSYQLSEMPIMDDYVIGPGDEIILSLQGGGMANHQVDKNGNISLFGGEPLHVAGITYAQLKTKIERLMNERFIGQQAYVTIGSYRSMRIFVLGDVLRPGPCMVSAASTMSAGLLACGGIKKEGTLRRIGLIRNGKQINSLDLYNFLLSGDTSKDPVLKAGDTIFAGPIQNTAAVAGEVNRPAIYEFIGTMTLDELLKTSGGLRPTSIRQLAQVERISKTGEITVIDIDLAAGGGSFVIQNGDIVKIHSALLASIDGDTIYVVGNVRNAGKRAYAANMRLSSVISSPGDLLQNTFLDYGIIERETGDEKEISIVRFNIKKVLERSPEADLALMPRDKVYIFNQVDLQPEQRVSIEGLVSTPGSYELRKNMTAIDLVLSAGGFAKDADPAFAELYHTDPSTAEVVLLHVDLNKAFEGAPESNPVLMEGDRLVIHSIWEKHFKKSVTISGEVRAPETYPLAAGARLLDVVLAAGGLTEKAYKKRVEITRFKVENGEKMEAEHFEVNLEAALRNDPKHNIQLTNYDHIMVRPITDWGESRSVSVTGAVAFPGQYTIARGERLSSVIKRAGGFGDDAFTLGARFARKSVAEMQKREMRDMADKLDMDAKRFALTPTSFGSEKSTDKIQMVLGSIQAMAEKLRNAQPEGRLIVDIPQDINSISKEEDMLLEDGDSIYIPQTPDTVIVMGEVYNPNAFKYRKDYMIPDYISMAGGFNEYANTKGTLLIKANGEVMPMRDGYFALPASLGPGDIILVPEEITRYSGLEFTKDITQIVYQTALSAASLKTLGIVK